MPSFCFKCEAWPLHLREVHCLIDDCIITPIRKCVSCSHASIIHTIQFCSSDCSPPDLNCHCHKRNHVDTWALCSSDCSPFVTGWRSGRRRTRRRWSRDAARSTSRDASRSKFRDVARSTTRDAAREPSRNAMRVSSQTALSVRARSRPRRPVIRVRDGASAVQEHGEGVVREGAVQAGDRGEGIVGDCQFPYFPSLERSRWVGFRVFLCRDECFVRRCKLVNTHRDLCRLTPAVGSSLVGLIVWC